MAKEKATPVREDEIDDIRVTIDTDDGSIECKIITIFEVEDNNYIALLPLDKDGKDNANGDVYLYRYYEDKDGNPSIEYIADEDEYEVAADKFDEILDEEMFDEMD